MKYERYDQETAYQTGETAVYVQEMCHITRTLLDKVDKVDAKLVRLVELNDYIAEKLRDFVDMEREMLEMQKEMFEDYKKVKEQAHVKLQGDYVSAHDPDHEE